MRTDFDTLYEKNKDRLDLCFINVYGKEIKESTVLEVNCICMIWAVWVVDGINIHTIDKYSPMDINTIYISKEMQGNLNNLFERFI